MKTEEIIKKLRLDKAKKILIINAPDEYSNILKGLNYDPKPLNDKEGNYDFIQVFAYKQIELETLVKKAVNFGKHDCLFWACYPKGYGRIKSDIKRDTVWIAFDLAGLQAVSQIAIDETWSALRGRPKDSIGK